MRRGSWLERRWCANRLESDRLSYIEQCSEAYSGTLTRREIVRANARLDELRRDKEI